MGSIAKLSASLLLLVCCSLPGRDYGPAVGSRLAAFDLPDQDGTLRSLGSLLGPKGAILLFYRSADW